MLHSLDPLALSCQAVKVGPCQRRDCSVVVMPLYFVFEHLSLAAVRKRRADKTSSFM